MTKSEQVINECIVSCTHKMQETLKMFGPKKIDPVLIKYDVEKIIKQYMLEMQKNG